jgi:hypothetical protein
LILSPFLCLLNLPFQFIRPSEKNFRVLTRGNRYVEQEFDTKHENWNWKNGFYQQLDEDAIYTFLQIRWDEARQG